MAGMIESAIAILPTAAPSQDLLRRMDTPGPRYTSYPTADRFDERFGAAQLEPLLCRLGDAGVRAPLSLYVHIPFCESVCYYCACNKIVTRHHARAQEYLDALELEMALVTDRIGAQHTLSQLHFGGGSPTFLSDAEITRLMASLRRFFHLAPDAELSIEVDPRTVTPARLDHLRAQGFNRLSFGIQDVDPAVQQAIHRVQSTESVRDLVVHARGLGFASINADLIYGLPLQTPDSLRHTIRTVADLGVDRIALYAYAHLPTRFKPQRRIAAADLPGAAQRVEMLGIALDELRRRGYDHIGMDHFALPQDGLAIARREGRLQRNFQGYSTHAECDLIALGVSSIGRIGNSYYQNEKTLDAYYAALSEPRLPVARGITLDREDLVRRDIIMALMCNGRVEFEAIDARHGGCMAADFRAELLRLDGLAADGLVTVHERGVEVTPAGWYVVRAIALVFDRHLQAGAARERFSRVV
jgi:oxygen-independent coproporphyrinogen-3 oxidase